MCDANVNASQLQLSVGQVDDTCALAQQWLEQLHHLADHGKYHDASVELAQANVMLGDVREKLEKAISALGGAIASDVSVELL